METARFYQSEESDVDFYKNASTSTETKRSTGNWMKVFESWAKSRNHHQEISSYEPDQLNKILEKFYVEVRKQNGDPYEPTCLRVMMASIDRHLRSRMYPKSIARDKDFFSSRAVLEGIARELRKEGKGNLPNRAKSLTNEEIECLWSSGQLGSHNPRALLNTMWWNNCMGMGMRGRELHHGMRVEDFEFKKDNLGKIVISYLYGNTKTNVGGLNFKPKKITGKLYETGGEHCPVKLFREYINRRPPSMRTSGPFYLAIIDHPLTTVWYKMNPMGIHTINNIMKTMKNNCPQLAGSSKKVTNHSARKTTVRKLREHGFQKCEIKNITGHASEKGLDAYDSGDEGELRSMSLALLSDESTRPKSNNSITTQSTSNSSASSLSYKELMEKQQVEIAKLFSQPSFCPSFSLYNNTGNFFRHQPSAEPPVVYNNCTFNMYSGPPSSEPERRKICTIESS